MRYIIFLSSIFFFLFLDPQQLKAQPKVVLSEKIYDFGLVPQGTVVEHDFILTNTGTLPLVINSVRPACGCTAALPPSGPIAPGQTGTITVTFNTSGYDGSKEKSVHVYTNDLTMQDFDIFLKGEVEGTIDIEPQSVNFGTVRSSGDFLLKNVQVKLKPLSTLKIKEISASSNLILIQNKVINDRSASFTVAFAPTGANGTLLQKVIITADNKGTPEYFTVPVTAKIEGTLIVEPRIVSFGLVTQDQILERDIKIASPKAGELNIHSYSSSDPAFGLTLKQIEPGTAYVLSVKLDPKKLTGDVRGTITVETNNKEQPQIELTAYAALPPKL